jgi:hypothetical protein
VVLTGEVSRTKSLVKLPGLPKEPVRTAPRLIRQHQRRLTATQKVTVAQQYRAGAEMCELAVTFGVHRTSVSHCLRELGVPLRRQGLRAEDVPTAAKLYEAGWSLARLGEKYGCAHTTVRSRLMEYGVTMRPRRGWKR